MNADRRWLLRSAGIVLGVIQRLEAVGVRLLGELAARDVDRVVAEICTQLRTPAWGSRRAALVRALLGIPSRS